MREGGQDGDRVGERARGRWGCGVGPSYLEELRQNHQLPWPGGERQVKVQGPVTGQCGRGGGDGRHQTPNFPWSPRGLQLWAEPTPRLQPRGASASQMPPARAETAARRPGIWSGGARAGARPGSGPSRQGKPWRRGAGAPPHLAASARGKGRLAAGSPAQTTPAGTPGPQVRLNEPRPADPPQSESPGDPWRSRGNGGGPQELTSSQRPSAAPSLAPAWRCLRLQPRKV